MSVKPGRNQPKAEDARTNDCCVSCLGCFVEIPLSLLRPLLSALGIVVAEICGVVPDCCTMFAISPNMIVEIFAENAVQ